jgi:hypothetical protein
MRWAVVLCAIAGAAVADPDPQTRGSEVIEIHDMPPAPAKQAKVKHRRYRIAPAYSDAAIEHDAWAIAWLLLDIDATGKVTRVKFLHYPGYDLEHTAIETALGLTFEPALDADGRAQRSYLIYPLEWPSYWWMVMHTGFATRIPAEAYANPCKGSGPLNLDYRDPVYRDCSGPDLSLGKTEPWYSAVPDDD